MTAATANRAPTEAEIREIIELYHDERDLPEPWDFASAYTAPVAFIPENERTGGANRVWANLRHSEAERLEELLGDVYDLATKEVEALEAKLRDAVVTACLTFAAEYPDAPRAEVLQPA